MSNVKALLFLCHWQRMLPRKNASKKREIPSATKKQMTNSEVNMEEAGPSANRDYIRSAPTMPAEVVATSSHDDLAELEKEKKKLETKEDKLEKEKKELEKEKNKLEKEQQTNSVVYEEILKQLTLVREQLAELFKQLTSVQEQLAEKEKQRTVLLTRTPAPANAAMPSKRPRLEELKSIAVCKVASESASCFATFSSKSSSSWVKNLHQEVYCIAPYRYKEALKAFISKANQSDASDFPYFTSFKYFNCDATLEYSSRLSRLVYSANMSWMTEEKEVKCKAVIVKFTNTYGDEVHKCMAESGFAPQLIAVHDLPPNWKVVIMDELQNRMDIGKDKYAVVRAAIKILHENGYVHGDLRLSNMFSCTNTESRIAVIDYDWAGKANEAKYPLWMNPACNWPQGASCGGIITVDHDNYWIDRNLT
ncbi:hypothetical protein EMCRGX_G029768 [Ephydatia muelleri]